MTVSKRMKNTAITITINVQRIAHRGRRVKKEQMMLQPSARKSGCKGKGKIEERDTLLEVG